MVLYLLAPPRALTIFYEFFMSVLRCISSNALQCLFDRFEFWCGDGGAFAKSVAWRCFGALECVTLSDFVAAPMTLSVASYYLVAAAESGSLKGQFPDWIDARDLAGGHWPARPHTILDADHDLLCPLSMLLV